MEENTGNVHHGAGAALRRRKARVRARTQPALSRRQRKQWTLNQVATFSACQIGSRTVLDNVHTTATVLTSCPFMRNDQTPGVGSWHSKKRVLPSRRINAKRVFLRLLTGRST
jgi:hypothetical protein